MTQTLPTGHQLSTPQTPHPIISIGGIRRTGVEKAAGVSSALIGRLLSSGVPPTPYLLTDIGLLAASSCRSVQGNPWTQLGLPVPFPPCPPTVASGMGPAPVLHNPASFIGEGQTRSEGAELQTCRCGGRGAGATPGGIAGRSEPSLHLIPAP